jgi:hypothetical protein
VQPLWKKIWRHLKNLNIGGIWSSSPTPRDIPKEIQHRLLQRHLHTHVNCDAIHNRQVMEKTMMPHYWWMDQENVVLVHKGILLSHEEEWNLIICR